MQIYTFYYVYRNTNPRMRTLGTTGPLEKDMVHPRLCPLRVILSHVPPLTSLFSSERRNYPKRMSSRSCQQSLMSPTHPLHLPGARAASCSLLCLWTSALFLNWRTNLSLTITKLIIWTFWLCMFLFGFSLGHGDLTMLSGLALNFWTIILEYSLDYRFVTPHLADICFLINLNLDSTD